jgi:hypothetical protein
MACYALRRDGVTTGTGLHALAAPAGYGPTDLQGAYNLPSGTSGGGATVAIVDAFDDPTAEADLATYRAQYGLPACTTANSCFRKTDQNGGGNYPAGDYSWAGEISLDLDMVSAICPHCGILLVEADTPDDVSLGTAENTAVALGAKYVSNSWGSSENLAGYVNGDAYYKHPGVAITFSTGDFGYSYGPSYPASLSYVTAVGGTSLSRSGSTARGWSEYAWSGGGSGCSAYQPKPSFQIDTGCANRVEADVSAVADPVTGVSVYDSYDGSGWNVYGGTSASSPIIAATYALAGTPGAGTYPNAYPYSHAAASNATALNDVAGGANGTCTPAYLCAAESGYDGPTGLGTPNGIAAFAAGAYGRLTGTVTDPATGKPIDGVRITAGANATTTNAAGGYAMSLPVGTYDVTAAEYGYGSATASAVPVADGQSTTRDFTLAKQRLVKVSGRIRDGSGHGWPIYASVQVAGQPSTKVYTDQDSGRYELRLPANSALDLQVNPVYTGYQATTTHLTTAGRSLAEDLAVPVDSASCDAPGYSAQYSNATEHFDGVTAPPGWSVVDNLGNGGAWRFDNPGGLDNMTGGSGGFAVADSNYGGRMDTSLLSPVLNLSAAKAPVIRFDTYYRSFSTDSGADVDLSVDGGLTWSTVWHRDVASALPGPQSVALPTAAGKSAVQVRFHYYSDTWSYYWQVDDVMFGAVACTPIRGGLVYGTVTDRNTGKPVGSAAVTGTGPATGATATTSPDGSYAAFSPATGTERFTVSADQYTTSTVAVHVGADRAERLDVPLAAGQLSVSAGSLAATVVQGGTATRQVVLKNTGTAPLTVGLTQRSGDLPALSSAALSSAAKSTPEFVPGHYSPLSLAAAKSRTGTGRASGAATKPAVTPSVATAWTSVTDYPTPVMDNAVATGPDGRVYSIGGIDGTAVLSGGYVYDPAAGTWSAIPGGPAIAREKAQAAFLGGRLYLTGGWDANGNTVATTEVYDPQRHTWSTAAPMPAAYAAAGSATVDGKWYLVGGCASDGCGRTEVEVYDPATDAWTTAADYPEPISWLSCGGISGVLYCAGGTTWVEGTRHGYAYDPATGVWSRLTDMPLDLWAAAYTEADGRFLISGGVSDLGQGETNTGYAYDPAARTWSALPATGNAFYRSGSACGFFKIGGAPSVFDARANVEELPGLDSCVPAADVPWLSSAPAAEQTLAPGQSVTVSVTFNAGVSAVDKTGLYTAALAITTDTPYVLSPIAVQMTVTR